MQAVSAIFRHHIHYLTLIIHIPLGRYFSKSSIRPAFSVDASILSWPSCTIAIVFAQFIANQKAVAYDIAG
jgi:hypothetical protein